MNGKRAYAAERRLKRTQFFKDEIKKIYERFTAAPFDVDYGDELEKLNKQYPKEKGLILIAEREFYQDLKKTKTLQTNM